ncbi:ADP-ribosylglycohydrolase family protein [Blastococcus sp. TML/M2B]|uniref:ADP-ribosylglycohydrolase family protein n=1 Tax=unclassified Blastococcus TaxID=2619396 RepID=UPI00190C8F6A|nr:MULTISPECIES: ADP-ribosylglycohydrolase family protein [unclassified Blastococcus]MBN1093314.1 ADP-ribosylglycohydrolase family protein [Blastococcus sp. TML/M2B]MBN1096571.1 ADP-ribosylglycohydrolase family protein [Blastococcus sp. TML/C7B]
MSSSMHRSHRVAGALVGSAVGDALGAPFEFGPAGAFSARFPAPARGAKTEMCGGGSLGWAPGEFTDDTQMALLVASSLVDAGRLDPADVFDRFAQWAAADPPDIGNQTRAVLGSGRPWSSAASEHFARSGHAAGNGSLMRATPSAIWFARFGTAATTDAARQLSALTHGDPSAGEGCAVHAELMRVALDGGDPLAAIPAALELVAPEHRERWATVLAPDWTPDQATESNGAVWPTLGQAVWALRHGSDFAEVLRLVIDLGGDTDTVACVAGGLAGAVHGMGGIPSRWASVVHGRVPGFAEKLWRLADLQQLAAALDGGVQQSYDPGVIPRIGPEEVLPGIWAANLDGARYSEQDFAVISLCRLGEPFEHELQRMAYVADNEHNSDLDVVLADVLEDMAALRAEGHRLLVHCHGGASRTGLVLRAWLMRTEGMTAEEATAHVAARWPHLGLWNASFTQALDRLAR